MLSQSDLDWFAARLSIAVYDTNRETPEMSVYELKEALKDITGIDTLTIQSASNGNQVLTIGDRTLEVSPAASHDEIRLALQNPVIRTENTKLTEKPKMVSKLQGVASRLAQLKHDSEFDAEKLLTRVDGVFTRKDAAFAKSHKFLDGHEKDLGDVEGFISEIEQATNGAP